MILFVHHRYRRVGGEEQAVAAWRALVEAELGEQTALLERRSEALSSSRAAAAMMLGGEHGLQVGRAVGQTGARVVHAHNLLPSFGWRGLAAARAAGAGVVLHLHNYRLVCAVGTCVDSAGDDCLRCHGRNTLPGLKHGCRGGRGEAAVYAAALALWQRRQMALADVIVVPSGAALQRLRDLGAPLSGRDVVVLGHPTPPPTVAHSTAGGGSYALVVSRLAPEKGVGDAIEACAAAGLPLVVCGDGPLAAALSARAAELGSNVKFYGRLEAGAIAQLRAGARLALVPSRAAETFGLAAAEARSAGLPVVATAVGALRDFGQADSGVQLAPPNDRGALAAAIAAVWRQADRLGEQALAAARRDNDPALKAAAIAAIYARAAGRAEGRRR